MLASIDPKTIRKIKMLAPSAEEINFILTHFPNLEEFIVDNATEQWIKKHAAKLENVTLRLTDNYKSKTLTLPLHGPKKIIVDRSQNNSNSLEFKTEPGSTTELILAGEKCSTHSLTYDKIPSVTLYIPGVNYDYPDIKKDYDQKNIKYTLIPKPYQKYIIPTIKQEELFILYSSFKKENDKPWQHKIANKSNIAVQTEIKIDSKESFPKVKKIIFEELAEDKDYLTKISSAFPNLEELVLKLRDKYELSMSAQCCFPKLKSLVLKSISLDGINSDSFPNVIDIAISGSYPSGSTLKSFGAKPYPHLKTLRIEKITDLKELNFALFPNLTKLHISDCNLTSLGDISKLRQLIISKCPHLKDINFETMDNLQDVTLDTYQNTDKAKNLCQLKVEFDRQDKSPQEMSFKNPNVEVIEFNHVQSKITVNDLPNLLHLKVKNGAGAYSCINHLNAANNPKLRIISGIDNATTSYTLKIMKSIPTLADVPKRADGIEYILVQEKPDSKTTALYEISGKPVTLKKLDIDEKRNLSEIIDIFPEGREPDASSKMISETQAAFIQSLLGYKSMIDASGCPNLQTLSGKIESVEIKLDTPDKQTALRFVGIKSGNMKLPTLPEDCTYQLSQPEKYYLDEKKVTVTSYNSNNDHRDYKKQDKKAPVEFKKDYAEIMRQNQRQRVNDDSPVSKFDFRGRRAADTDLRKDYVHHAKDDFTVNFHSKKAAQKNKYRIEIWDGIIDDWKNNLTFITSDSYLTPTSLAIKPISNERLVQLDTWAFSSEENVLGVFTITNQVGPIDIPIPTEEAVDPGKSFEFYCNPPDKLNISWNEKTRQYYVHLPAGRNDLTLFYAHKRNLSYEEKPTGNLVVTNPQTLLSHTLIEKITALIKTNSALGFLLDSKLSVDARLEELQKYCASFGDEKETPLKLGRGITSIEALFRRITHRAGACYERSQAFMLLAQYLGVHVLTIGNEKHQFCDIPYTGGLKRIDLGGLPLRDETDPNVRKDILDEMVKKAKEKIQPPSAILKKSPSKFTEKELRKKEEYAQLFKVQEKPEISLKLLNENLNKNVLIELPASEDTLSLYPKIINSIQNDLKSDYFYIHDPDEFKDFFNIYYQEKGERKEGDGPLAKIIRNGGTLIVNWAFTPAQIISYQSVLDTKANLHGKPFEKPVNVIGLIRPGTISCKAFQSRCRTFVASEEFVRELKSPPAPLLQRREKDLPIEIDLFSQANWRDLLIETVNYAGDKVNFIEKELLRAIATRSPLTIYNPPNDEVFKVFLNRLTQEKRLFHNGVYIPIPPEVIIKTEQKSHGDILDRVSKRVTLVRESLEKDEKPQSRIYLGLYNLHECYESLRVKGTQGFTEQKGYLDSYTDAQEFYITDAIPKANWEKLMDEIDKKHPNKKFRFVLSPTAYITEVNEKTTAPKKTKDSHIILSNDCDFQIHQIKQAKPDALVIDVTPQMSFQDLVAKITKHDQKVEFNYEEKGLLKALVAGRTVILNGELSSRLYQQLLPLLTTDPATKISHIYSNGQRIDVPKGQLYAVMSTSAQDRLALAEYQEKIYQNQDYLNEFKHDTKHINDILQFYEFVKKVVPRPGYPAPPQLSFVHLNNMLKALKESKLHARNPIKHLFHYQYKQTDRIDAQSSEDYAYLNVIAKYIFKPLDAVIETPEKINKRLKKLKKIYQFITDKKLDPAAYVWQLLNALSITDLQSIFGNVDTILEGGNKFPTLKIDLLKKLLLKVETLSKSQADEKSNLADAKALPPKSDFTKRDDTVQELLRTLQLINIKGAPGTGKSFIIEQLELLGISCYDGTDEEAINKWRNDKEPGKKKVLFVHEANMSLPGSWNALKPVARDDKTFFHQGEFHPEPLTDLHKVIVTGNPENYTGRYIHQFFQEYGGIIYFKMPSDLTIKENILKEFTQTYGKEYIDALLASYHLIKEYNPGFVYSIRDLKNASLSFEVLAKDSKEITKDLLFKVCVSEFAGTIENPERRKKFIDDLARQFGLPIADQKNTGLIKLESGEETYFLPKDKQYLLDAIEIDLKIRDQPQPPDEKDAADIKHKYYKKPGFLFEGEPGVGKSTLFRLALEKQGFSEIKLKPGETLLTAKPAKPHLCFVEINAGDDSALEILEQAYEKQYIVILNEPNIDPKLEKKANELLDKAKNKPLFRVYASQNPSTHEDRIDTPALNNRLNFNYMDAYSIESLLEIAQAKGIECPEIFVDQFMKSGATMRTFFNAVNRLEEQAKWTFDYYSAVDKTGNQFPSYRLFSEKKLHPGLDLKVEANDPKFGLYDSRDEALKSIKTDIPALDKKKDSKHSGIDVSDITEHLIAWNQTSANVNNITALAKLVNIILDIQVKYRKEKILSIPKHKEQMMLDIEIALLKNIYNKNTLNTICWDMHDIIKARQKILIDKDKTGTLIKFMDDALKEMKLIGIENLIDTYITKDAVIAVNRDFANKLATAAKVFLQDQYTSIAEPDFKKLTFAIKCILTLRDLCKNPTAEDIIEINRIEQKALAIIAEKKLLDSHNMFDALLSASFFIEMEHTSPSLNEAKTRIMNYFQPVPDKEAKQAPNPAAGFFPAPRDHKQADVKQQPLERLFKEFTEQFSMLEKRIKLSADKNMLIDIPLCEIRSLAKQADIEKKFPVIIATLRELEARIPATSRDLKQQITLTCNYFSDALKAHANRRPFPLA